MRTRFLRRNPTSSSLHDRPLAPDVARDLIAKWEVVEADLGRLVRLDAEDMARLLGGEEPAGLEVDTAIRLGILAGALPKIAARRGRKPVRDAMRGAAPGSVAAAIFDVSDLKGLVAALDALDAALAKRV